MSELPDTAAARARRGRASPTRRDHAGNLELSFARDYDGRTFLHRQRASYPFHVCRTHSFPGDPPGMATLYQQSCSGGIYEGDALRLRFVADRGARVHLTSQASTIVHTMPKAAASQAVELEARAGSYLEYMPDPLILFPQARLAASLRVRAADTACVVIADSFITHDPYATGESFAWLENDAWIEDHDGAVLARDRFRAEGTALALHRPGINGAYAAQGTLLLFAPQHEPPRLVADLRSEIDELSGAYAGASLLPHDCGAWVRILAADGAALRSAMHALWSRARLALCGRRPVVRRK